MESKFAGQETGFNWEGLIEKAMNNEGLSSLITGVVSKYNTQ